MYYNPINGKLEPVGFDGDSGRKSNYPNQFLHAIKDTNYIKAYVEAIEKFTEPEYIDQIKNWPGSEDLKGILESNFNPYKWETEFIDFNRLILQKMTTPKNTINVFLESADEKGLTISIVNFGRLPVEIEGLSDLNGRTIASIPKSRKVFPKKKELIRFSYVENYERLFVNKKGRVNFDLYKEIEKLKIDFRVLGSKYSLRSDIYAWGSEDEKVLASSDIIKKESTVKDFDFLHVDENKKIVVAETGTHKVSKPMIIPLGYRFIVSPGTNFDFITSNSSIISYGTLEWRGTSEDPIRIYSSTSDGRGIIVMNATDTSQMQYCIFDNLSNLKSTYWSVSGAVNFYESDVSIKNCVFKNNRCEDALNVIRADIQMVGSQFKNIQSDAFDGDFVTGRISKTSFINLGNDGVDVSGSSVYLSDITLDKAGDKAISGGEDSYLSLERVLIKNSAIAIASKDNSKIEVEDISLFMNQLGFTAFQKKPEFGPASIIASQVVFQKQETLHLIENSSKLILNGETADTQSKVKDQMYGVIYGKKSVK